MRRGISRYDVMALVISALLGLIVGGVLIVLVTL